MKNVKNVAFGLVAGALALGFSAFTNAPKSTSTENVNFAISHDYLVQRTTGQFTPTDPSDPSAVPSSGFCNPTTTAYRCYYKVTDAGKANIRALSGPSDFYSDSEIDSYLMAAPAPYLTLVSGTSSALYED